MGVEEWVKGRLADNFAHLKNTINRLLLDPMEHGDKFKVDKQKIKHGSGEVRQLLIPQETKSPFQERTFEM